MNYTYDNDSRLTQVTDPTGDGGGGSFDCASDGIAVPCWMANMEIESGAGVQCPNNYCGLGSATPYQCVGSVCGYMSTQYVATHENEWGGVLYSDSEWTDFLVDRREGTREALADAISWASENPNVTWDIVYNHLEWQDTQGGNADFGWRATLDDGTTITLANLQLDIPGISAGGCEWSCRAGSMPSLHYNKDMFHLDTANPAWGFGLGLFIHGFSDVLLGNINPSVPMVH